MISQEDRINFYIGDCDYDVSVEPFDRSNIESHPFDYPFKVESGKSCRSRLSYDVDIARYCSYMTLNELWFNCGDIPSENTYPTLIKIRDSFNVKSVGILANLNSNRHWSLVGPVIKNDAPWDYKKNDWMWRGADTGKNMDDNPRFNFVKKFYHTHDVAFSGKLQNKSIYPNLYTDDLYESPRSLEHIINYKYQPVLEGNDKSSALNWILASNCVPIMSKPRFHSWLCEEYLVPGVHYVECKRDFSNFLDKIQWCKDNDKKAKEIALNGRRFISDNFGDPKREYSIEKSLIEFVENKK